MERVGLRKMRYSGIGGQAVMEGVMMRNGDRYAVAVRKPDQEIELKVSDYPSARKTEGLRKIPFVRGVFSFVDSLVLGMRTLMYSASFFEEEQEESSVDRAKGQEKSSLDGGNGQKESSLDGGNAQKESSFLDGGNGQEKLSPDRANGQEKSSLDGGNGQKESSLDGGNGQKESSFLDGGNGQKESSLDGGNGQKGASKDNVNAWEKVPVDPTGEERERLARKKKRQDDLYMGLTMVFAIIFAVGLFFALPYFLSTLLRHAEVSDTLVILTEGILRLVIFITYIALISKNRDIQRVFMYHGAEHKCINCIESGLPLTVDNVRISSKEHKRCGTSFLLIVMLISILVFLFIRVEGRWLQLLCRLLLIPVIAGISYEFLRLAGRSDNRCINLLSKPGLWMQGLTTKEPDDSMIEVGIASVEAVFDWRKWQKENGR